MVGAERMMFELLCIEETVDIRLEDEWYSEVEKVLVTVSSFSRVVVRKT